MKNSILCTSALLLTGIVPMLTGCRNNAQPQAAPIVDGNAAMSDPASANMLPGSSTPQQYGAAPYGGAPVTRVAGAQYAAAPRTSTETYPQQAAPSYGVGNSQQNEAYQYNTQQPQSAQVGQNEQGAPPISGQEYDQYSDLLDSSVPAATQPPPPLPVDYEQPEAPGPDYLWTPGYWDYASAGYYYVPGTWVGAPYSGALWTPGWWGYGGNRYRWHHGYWGRHVGYYGGVNYGFGFIGFGYQGGYWNGDHFFYNRAVNRVNARVVNNYVYERRVSVTNNTYINNSRTSYFGGPGGLRRPPAPQEFAARTEPRIPPMQAQIAHRQAAEQNRQQFFNANNGRPQVLAAARPLAADRGVMAPPRTMPAQGFANGRQESVPPGGNMNPQQRQQFEQGQRLGVEQQRLGVEQQRLGQNQQQQNLQRQQQETQRLQVQQGNLQHQQQEAQQRQQQETQRLQVQQGNLQQRQQQEVQRQQLNTQREAQANTQRQQLEDQQRNQQVQQRQVEQQQRQQLEVQRQQQVNAQQQQQQQVNAQQQRQQADAARQQQQVNTQREQQATQQRQLMDTQRQQQNLQRQQPAIQQTARPAPAAAPRVEAPRAAPAPHVEAPRPAPAPHMEAPHAAPAAPHAEAPHTEHH